MSKKLVQGIEKIIKQEIKVLLEDERPIDTSRAVRQPEPPPDTSRAVRSPGPGLSQEDHIFLNKVKKNIEEATAVLSSLPKGSINPQIAQVFMEETYQKFEHVLINTFRR